MKSKVELICGKSKKADLYWHIYANGIRAGYVSISAVTASILGKYYSIQIFLNKKSQGQGIGRKGYQLACQASKLSTIYAHMRKNNIASQKAATAAGFKEVVNPKFKQIVMVWKK